MDKFTEAEIKMRAFELWSQSGYPEGQELVYWERAMTEHVRKAAVAKRAREARARLRCSGSSFHPNRRRCDAAL